MTQIMILGIAIAAFLLLIGIFTLCFYKRTTKELAYVRTGLGGQRVCKDGALLIIPMIHQVVPVKMNTFRMSVSRSEKNAMITKDRMRADIAVDFFIRVKSTAESIANAAQTLGRRTLNPDQLREIIEAKLESAMRSVASGMTMEELHEQRPLFTQAVLTAVSEDLEKNGLELESVSLTSLDQSDIRHFAEDNLFDAEGKTKLTATVESRRKQRNDIEQDNAVAIKQKNLEAQKQILDIQRENEYAILNQAREISIRKAEQAALIAAEEAKKNQEAEQARIDANREIQLGRIQAEQATLKGEIEKKLSVDTAEIESKKALQLAEQEKQIAVSARSEQESAAKIKADDARAKAIRAEELVETARQTEVAEREKAIAIIEAKKQAEKDAVGMKVQAEAEKEAAENYASARLIAAEAERDANIAIAVGKKEMFAVEATGLRATNEAHNLLKDEQIAANVRTKIIESLPAIIKEAAEPMQNIDSIKIIQIDGITKGGSSGAASTAAAGSSLSDQVVNSALSYRAQAPLLDSLLSEIGIIGSNINGYNGILDIKENPLKAAPVPAAVPVPAVNPEFDPEPGSPAAD